MLYRFMLLPVCTRPANWPIVIRNVDLCGLCSSNQYPQHECSSMEPALCVYAAVDKTIH